MNFEKNIENLKMQHKITVREAIDFQNIYVVSNQSLKKIKERIADIKNGHSRHLQNPKEEIKRLQKDAVHHKTKLDGLIEILRDAKKKAVPNY